MRLLEVVPDDLLELAQPFLGRSLEPRGDAVRVGDRPLPEEREQLGAWIDSLE